MYIIRYKGTKKLENRGMLESLLTRKRENYELIEPKLKNEVIPLQHKSIVQHFKH